MSSTSEVIQLTFTANTSPMSKAIVILNYNGKQHLQTYLPSVVEYSPGWTIFVADNASTDSSISFLKEHYAQIQIIELNQNFGFAGGYNEALQQLAGQFEFYFILNSDVRLSPNWDTPLLDFIQANPEVAAVQPQVLSDRDHTLFEHAGAAGGYLDSLYFPFCRGRLFETVETNHGQYDSVQEVTWVSGAAMLIRAQDFHEAAGFDAAFFAHMEEIDLCWRLKKANYKIMVCPESTVWHVGGGTLQAESPRKVYLNFRNSLSTLLKNKETAFSAILTVYIRLLLDAVAGLMFLTKGKFSHIFAIAKAHWHFFAGLGRDWKKRNTNQKLIKALAFDKNPTLNSKGIYNKSIVFQHFARKIDKFSDLKAEAKS